MVATVTASIQAASAIPGTTLDSGTLTPTGANKVIYALVASAASAPSNVSAVKYASASGVGGESLTQLGTTRTIGTFLKASLFRLIGPSAASGTIHATFAGTEDERAIIAVAVQDADQTTPNNTLASAGGTTNTPTVNATSVAGNLVLDFLWCVDGGGVNFTITEDASQTPIEQIESGAVGVPYDDAGASRETAAGTSTTMSWTMDGAGAKDWGIFALAIVDAAAGGAITGSAALSLAVTGALTGAGALVGAVPLAITPVGALTGAGALAGSVAMALTPSGVLTGAGALLGSVPLTLSPSGALTGAGALASTVSLALDVAGILASQDAGAITGTVPVTLTVSGSLTGAGALSSVIDFAFIPVGTFTPQVIASEVFGGGFIVDFEREQIRRAKERRRRLELEEESERIEEETTRAIALLLREQEAKDARRAELSRLSDLVARTAGRGDEAALSPRVQKAIQTVAAKQTTWALFQLEREMRRAQEEEQFLMHALSMAISYYE